MDNLSSNFNIFLLDLKQELKIRNISIPARKNNDTSNISTTSSSPSKHNSMDASVSKLNDLNDSKNNNNLSLNASSLDNTSSTTFNNTSLMDTTITHNMSCGAPTDLSKSHNNDTTLNKSSQNSVLKCKFRKLLACWKF